MNRAVNTVVRALGCLLGAALIVVTIPVPHAAEPVTISYAGDLATLSRLAPYPAVAPAGLPGDWQPVSSGLTAGGATGAGTVTWQLGFMTPDGALAALEESNASAAAFIRRMTNDGVNPKTPQAAVRVNGQVWSLSSVPARGQRSMYFTSPDRFTVVVTGNATWAQLRELAGALRPVLR